ncbi:MAG: N-acetyl-gamma-glutamyl-phosphate reductase [Ignavibacteria bacterium]
MFKVSIIGATGYSGIELIKLLSSRDDVYIDRVFSNLSPGRMISEINPSLPKLADIKTEKYSPGTLISTDIAFLSLPPGESMKIVPELFDSGIKVIDLAGDFRLNDASAYNEYYNFQHLYPELLDKSVYGLTELFKDEIKYTKLVANPGCYATGIILALMPALKNKLIYESGIVINSLSGISGAGKKESLEYSFYELNENIRAYKLTGHQHIPEIEQALERAAGCRIQFSFIPHLVPVNRGIYTTIIAEMKRDIDSDTIYSFYNDEYKETPFIRVKKDIPQIKNVVHTNFCDIFFEIDKKTNKLIIISVLDNLMKGAAGQAIQNMNLMLGLPETSGLIKMEKLYV